MSRQSTQSRLIYIFHFLFRLGIKSLQIMLTPRPISMSHTLITSLHHNFINLGLMNLIFHRMLCRKDLVPILPGIHYNPSFLVYIYPDSVFDQDGSWASITHLVKCTSWTITNGFPVLVIKKSKKKEACLLTII